MSYPYYPPIQYGYPQYEVYQEEDRPTNPLITLLMLAALGYIASVIYNIYINKDEESKPKFTLGESKSTELNDIGSKEHYFLDRHNVTCGNKSGINRFQYTLGDQTNNDTKDKFQYKYTCTNGGDLEDIDASKTTATNDGGNGNVYFLDRQEIICPSDEILNKFKLERPGEPNKIYYSYNCIKSKKPLTCRTAHTEKVNIVNDDNTKNLKNYNVSCAKDEVLQRFLLKRGTPDSLVGYDYTCCKY